MSTIHLWDNSWHVEQPNESIMDSFGRKPRVLNIKPKDDTLVLKSLSSYTIGELMKSEENAVLVWPNSFQDGNDELKDQYIFRVSEKDGKTIDSITTGDVVGFIGKDNTDIRIHSRFFSGEDKNIKDYFLYHMLGKVLAINMFDLPTSSGTDMAFDFLLFFFPKLLKEAMSQGMYKKYVYHEYNDANVRGVIDINRHIRKNIPANGRIAYRTREFSYDNPMTQLIRHTIEFIRRKPFGMAVLHNDSDTEAYVQQIVQATPTFVARQQQAVIYDNLRPIVHPYYTKYAALQKLCLRILRHEKLSYGQANDKIHGLLIDAAWLWEEYMAKVLSEGQSGLKHYTRNSRYHLFKTATGKAFQQIIPDYYDGDKIVADAKYIPLHRYDHLDAERASAVYYKTIMYMYRFHTKKGFLFHPCSQEDKDKISITHLDLEDKTISCDYQVEDRPDCHLYEVGMIIDDSSNFNDFKQKMKETEEAFWMKVQNKIKEPSKVKET
jgi:McrBC 5-methylcytosine restriction system component